MPAENTTRYFIELSFDGTAYHGWQIQPNALTVQQTLEEAFFTILRQKTGFTGAGRTDTGVHALSYMAHFDADLSGSGLAPAGLIYKVNCILPPDIAIKTIRPVQPDAHARFSALWRNYEYRITLHKDPFLVGRAWRIPHPPDLDMIRQATQILFEYSDYECFSKSNTQVNNYRCRIMEASWVEENSLIIFRIKADRFLRNMVRAIVGTLMNVGTGKINLTDLRAIIESKNRSNAGYSVPGYGLYFTGAGYPDEVYC